MHCPQDGKAYLRQRGKKKSLAHCSNKEALPGRHVRSLYVLAYTTETKKVKHTDGFWVLKMLAVCVVHSGPA